MANDLGFGGRLRMALAKAARTHPGEPTVTVTEWAPGAVVVTYEWVMNVGVRVVSRAHVSINGVLAR